MVVIRCSRASPSNVCPCRSSSKTYPPRTARISRDSTPRRSTSCRCRSSRTRSRTRRSGCPSRSIAIRSTSSRCRSSRKTCRRCTWSAHRRSTAARSTSCPFRSNTKTFRSRTSSRPSIRSKRKTTKTTKTTRTTKMRTTCCSTSSSRGYKPRPNRRTCCRRTPPRSSPRRCRRRIRNTSPCSLHTSSTSSRPRLSPAASPSRRCIPRSPAPRSTTPSSCCSTTNRSDRNSKRAARPCSTSSIHRGRSYCRIHCKRRGREKRGEARGRSCSRGPSQCSCLLRNARILRISRIHGAIVAQAGVTPSATSALDVRGSCDNPKPVE